MTVRIYSTKTGRLLLVMPGSAGCFILTTESKDAIDAIVGHSNWRSIAYWGYGE